MTHAVAVRKPDNHREALAYARRFIATVRDDPTRYSFKSGSRAAVRELMTIALRDARGMMRVVDYARAGWDIAHEALLDLLLEYDNRGEQPPTILTEYRMRVLAGYAPKTGQQKADLIFRNLSLAVLVWRLTEEFGLSASAAYRLVVQAWKLEMKGRGVALIDFKSVESIWREMAPRISFLETDT